VDFVSLHHPNVSVKALKGTASPGSFHWTPDRRRVVAFMLAL